MEAHQVTPADALPFLERAAEFDTSAGMVTLEEILRGSVCMTVAVDGERVGAYALQLSTHDNGTVLWCMAMGAGMPGRDLAPDLLNIIEQQGKQAGAAQVAFTTKRRGAINKLLRHGYEITGVQLRKKI